VSEKELSVSRRYTSDEKTAILAQLQSNHGDIALTRLQSGIPERTLREWRRELWLNHLPPLPPPPTPLRRQETTSESLDVGAHGCAPTLDTPTFANDLEAVVFLRNQIMKELLSLSASLNNSLSITTPYQRVLVLTQLLDRLMKLDEHLKPYASFDDGDDDIQIAYDKPSYERDDDEAGLESDPLSYPFTQEPQDVEQP
jgi:transposase-like protein